MILEVISAVTNHPVFEIAKSLKKFNILTKPFRYLTHVISHPNAAEGHPWVGYYKVEIVCQFQPRTTHGQNRKDTTSQYIESESEHFIGQSLTFYSSLALVGTKTRTTNVVRNARCAHSRYTLKLSLKFF